MRKKNHILNLYRAKDNRKIKRDGINEVNESIFGWGRIKPEKKFNEK